MWIRNIIGIIVLITLIGAGYWYYLQQQQVSSGAAKGQAGPPQGFAIPVETATVQTGPIIRSVEAVGTLRANESVIVRPELDGRVIAINFEEGQEVEQGTPLIGLDDSIFSAELEQAKARLALAQSNYQRAQTMRGRGLGSEQERDQTLSELRVRQAEVALAEARLAKMTINAPFAGVVGLREISVGDYVSVGQNIVDLLDLDELKVDFRIPEVFLAEVKAGQAIEVKVDAFPEQTFTGRVYAIDPQVDVNGRSIVIRARIPNLGNRLQAGLFARVDLIVDRKENALLVPEETLVPQGEQQFVFRVVDDKAAWTEVRTGQRQGAQVEITEGLAAGDTIVAAGQTKIRDGAAVKPLPPKEG